MIVGETVGYSPHYLKRLKAHPADKEYARKMRGKIVGARGPLVAVLWEGSSESASYKYGVEVVPEAEIGGEDVSEELVPRSWSDLRIFRSRLYTPDGVLDLKRKIGKGMFSTVYEVPELRKPVLAVVKPGAYEKEFLAKAHEELPDNPHIPAVEKLGETRDDFQVFVMPKYKSPLRLADLRPSDQKAYRKIRECVVSAHDSAEKVRCVERGGVDPEITEALRQIYDSSLDYGDHYSIEIAPRNLASDAAGNLVLLDLFFDPEMLRRRA